VSFSFLSRRLFLFLFGKNSDFGVERSLFLRVPLGASVCLLVFRFFSLSALIFHAASGTTRRLKSCVEGPNQCGSFFRLEPSYFLLQSEISLQRYPPFAFRGGGGRLGLFLSCFLRSPSSFLLPLAFFLQPPLFLSRIAFGAIRGDTF
jgi:hypothetical protein